VIVIGVKHSYKEDQRLSIRSDVMFPTLYQIRRQGKFNTPVAYATAHVAALFVKYFRGYSRACFRRRLFRWKCGARFCWGEEERREDRAQGDAVEAGRRRRRFVASTLRWTLREMAFQQQRLGREYLRFSCST